MDGGGQKTQQLASPPLTQIILICEGRKATPNPKPHKNYSDHNHHSCWPTSTDVAVLLCVTWGQSKGPSSVLLVLLLLAAATAAATLTENL